MRLGLALRAFWLALFDHDAGERIAIVLDTPSGSLTEEQPAVKATTDPPMRTPLPTQSVPAQNPAITLLATLQRDARLIDLIYENLDQYQDAQVGAAARPCLKQCRQSLDRILKIEKLMAATENDTVSVPADAAVSRFRWLGESSPSKTSTAKLVHPGWQAVSIQLPQWSGDAEDAEIIAPAQVTSE